MTDENEYYVIAVNDLFKVSKDDVDSREAAEVYVAERLGTEPFSAHDLEVIEEIEGATKDG